MLGRHDFFCGEFSVADFALFMTVLWTLRLRGPDLGAFPALSAWCARVGARPPGALATAEIAAADRELSPKL